MPFPVDAEAIETYEEARSVLGSMVTQMIAIVRQMLTYVYILTRQVMTYAGEHPLALTLLVCNVMIWVS